MKHAKFWNIFSIIIWVALVLSEAVLGWQLLQLDMLPPAYLYAVFGILVLLAVLLGLLVRQRSGKYQKSPQPITARRIVGYILSVILIILCWIGIHVISQVNDTIDAVTDTPSTDIIAIVDVYVQADDPAQTLDDTADYTFGVTDSYDWQNTQAALSLLEQQLGTDLEPTVYASVFEMIDALYAGEINALLLNSAYVDILDDMDGYDDFSEKARVIHEFSIEESMLQEIELPTEESTEESTDESTEETTEATEPIHIDDGAFIIYLSGSDTRSKLLTTSRSDVNILAVVNPNTRQVLLVNTPRDYYVSNPASSSGTRDKLTHCGIYGVNCSIRALERLYSTDIAYYAQINFTGFEALIDAVGGVTVYSDVAFTTHHGSLRINVGDNYLNGAQALSFARERYALAGGDNARGKNQMKIITAVIKKMTSGTTIISNYSSILNSLEGMFVTNMPQQTISDLVKMQLADMSPWEIFSYAVTGTGGSATTYSTPSTYLYVMYPNQSTVNHASKLIARVLSGEVISSSDLS